MEISLVEDVYGTYAIVKAGPATHITKCELQVMHIVIAIEGICRLVLNAL